MFFFPSISAISRDLPGKKTPQVSTLSLIQWLFLPSFVAAVVPLLGIWWQASRQEAEEHLGGWKPWGGTPIVTGGTPLDDAGWLGTSQTNMDVVFFFYSQGSTTSFAAMIGYEYGGNGHFFVG